MWNEAIRRHRIRMPQETTGTMPKVQYLKIKWLRMEKTPTVRPGKLNDSKAKKKKKKSMSKPILEKLQSARPERKIAIISRIPLQRGTSKGARAPAENHRGRTRIRKEEVKRRLFTGNVTERIMQNVRRHLQNTNDPI